MNIHKRCASLIVLLLILHGCIPIPYFERDPFSDDVTNLKLGSTTKNDVITQFGEPKATYDQKSEFVYSEFETKVAFIAYGGGGSLSGEQHFLVLSFNENGVLNNYFVKAATPYKDGCIDAEWCVGKWNEVLRLADAEEEAAAKQFPVSGNHCGVYVYGIYGVLAVSIDGENMGNTGQIGFQYWIVNPGTHEIAVFAQVELKLWGWKKPEIRTLSLECLKGDLNFITLKRQNWRTVILDLVDQSEGRKEIEKRDLIIPGPMRNIPDS